MLTFACVLRSGGEYGVVDVYRLRKAIEKHYRGAYRFISLTDLDIPGVWCVPLKHNWPGWWSKIELFRPELFPPGQVLYFDLDTAIIGSLWDIVDGAAPFAFAMLQDFTVPSQLASGVMSWAAGVGTPIYEDFVPQAANVMHTFGTMTGWGDQAWIAQVMGAAENPYAMARLQSIAPGQIVSYKVHCADGIPYDARVVCFHGRPKWRDLSDDDPIMRMAA